MNCGWLIKRFVFLGRVWMNLPQFIKSCCAFKCDIFGMRFVCLLSAFYDGHKAQVVCFIKKKIIGILQQFDVIAFCFWCRQSCRLPAMKSKECQCEMNRENKWRTHKKCSRNIQKPSSEMPLNFSITFVCVWHTDVLFI